MSRVLRSDKSKARKPETQIVGSDVALNKNIKKQNAFRALKTSTQTKASVPVTDDELKYKNKVANGATTTSGNERKGLHKSQHQGKPNVSSKHVPIRAKQLPTTSKVIGATGQNHISATTNSTMVKKTPVNKKQNVVLDTPHNVTVCSPPPKRKVANNGDEGTDHSRLTRKGSRTLAPDEIVILKREPSKMSREENVRTENLQMENTMTNGLKEPVAFEVKFKDKAVKERSGFREKINAVVWGLDGDGEELNYSDDFESYESDFESDSSVGSLEKSDSSSLQNKYGSEIFPETSEHGERYKGVSNQDSSLNQLICDGCEHEDLSEVTQSSITEIQRDKERKLDSGNYEMSSAKINVPKLSEMSVQFIQPVTDSFEISSIAISERMDSGISTCATSIPVSYNASVVEIVYSGYKDFYVKPIVNARGSELMKKVQLDSLSFTLIDLKPISYDIFMQNFGKLNTNQNFTQTEVNQMNVEQQTEVQDTRSIWTQHPTQLEIAKNFDENGSFLQHCCGEIVDELQPRLPSPCELEQSLRDIKGLNNENPMRGYHDFQKQQRRPINYEYLNSFLLRSSLLLDQILGSSNTNTKNKLIQDPPPHENDQVLRRVCEKSFYMKTNFLNTLRVLKLFSNNKYNLLITVHESLPDTNVYISDFVNLLMVWCTNTCDKPLRLLTTWSEVSKVEISNDSSDIVVAALRDGSIALWDLRETHSFCSKLDGYLTHFAATQSIIPSWCEEKYDSKSIMDLGACLDVKSFKSQPSNMLTQAMLPKTQFVSLHDSGLVAVWTLVESSEITEGSLSQADKYERPKYSSKFPHTFEYTSPWGRVKLMQSALANIKEHFETKSYHSQSRFDKTKAFFQQNIYSDETLRELHEFTSGVGQQQGIRFSSLECSSENLFICTNRNFILMCSKTLKMDKLKRIIINESQFLFPTALKVLSNEHFLAVGLSNGVVMILNCQFPKIAQTHAQTNKSTISESIDTNGDPILDCSAITGKSCAIQNILLNVQKSYEDMDFDREYRPSTAACIALIENKKKPFELRILDQQVIMSGSVLRKNLIQSLELSSDGWYLFALANGHVRAFDFYLDQEVSYRETNETGDIIGIATAKCSCRENNLMILRPSTEVEVHILNKQ